MTSGFEAFAEHFAVPMAREVFGSRDSGGKLAEVIAHPAGRDSVKIEGAILGPEETNQIELSNGNIENRNTRSLSFQRQAGLVVIEMKMKFEIDGRMWAVQLNGNRDDGTWLTYQLERKPLAQLDPKRDARTV